jgi:HSP20 family molecular chaperone IbpA
MFDPPQTLPDCNLEATTALSLKREPACFAFLCARAICPPQPIDSINLDLASVDHYAGRASVWTTLDMRSGASNDQPASILGFDDSFLRPFTRALIAASASRTPYRMTITPDTEERARQRVVEYITGPGISLSEIVLTPQDNVVVISGRTEAQDEDEILFQLPRTDSFLRAFAKMTCQADQALQATLTQSERLARQSNARPPSIR